MHDRWRTLATQLYLAVCERRMETDEYLTRLERLREWNKDRLIDHVRAWRLLASVGRRGEAIERAQAFSDLPTTGLETLQLAQAFFALGLRDSAAKLLDHFSTEFSFLDALWALYANLLIESQQWSRLHQLALNIRLNNDVRERLHDLSWYLEGRTELGLNRLGAATQALAVVGQRAVRTRVGQASRLHSPALH